MTRWLLRSGLFLLPAFFSGGCSCVVINGTVLPPAQLPPPEGIPEQFRSITVGTQPDGVQPFQMTGTQDIQDAPEELRAQAGEELANPSAVGVPGVGTGSFLGGLFTGGNSGGSSANNGSPAANYTGTDTHLGLPCYNYHQGLVVGQGGVIVVGQVRVVGGIYSGANTELKAGAMVTAAPEALAGRLNPVRSRWQVDSWREK